MIVLFVIIIIINIKTVTTSFINANDHKKDAITNSKNTLVLYWDFGTK